jgi:glycosyltransferase involved in cell wall biosynthesis
VSVRLAYLCNLYPAVSHSFVRREIEGVEQAGCEVHRFSVRPARNDLRDQADLREAAKTETILKQGFWRLSAFALIMCASRPAKMIDAARTAARLSGPGFSPKLRHLAYWLEAAWLARRLNHLGVEHLHAHFGTNPAAVAAITRAWGGPPFSFTVHGPKEFDAPVALSLAAKIEAASFVAAISSYGRSQLMRWTDTIYWDRIKIVRCGLDSAFIEAGVAPIPDDSTQLVCVARLSAQKGLPLLVAACDRLRNAGERFTLTIIGDGEMRESLEHDIRRRGLGDHIQLAGVRSSAEIRASLVAARAFILPSFGEGLPVVLMEALAMCRPVVATAIAGIPELVDEECGWLIPAGSEDALVAAITQLLRESAQQLAAKGQVGRERVRVMHDAGRNAALIIDAIAAAHAASRSSVLNDVEATANAVQAIPHDANHLGELPEHHEPGDKRRVSRRQTAG